MCYKTALLRLAIVLGPSYVAAYLTGEMVWWYQLWSGVAYLPLPLAPLNARRHGSMRTTEGIRRMMPTGRKRPRARARATSRAERGMLCLMSHPILTGYWNESLI